jgi:excisionase family DNA binding protein
MKTPKNVKELVRHLHDEFDVLETLCKYGPPLSQVNVSETLPVDGFPPTQDDRFSMDLEVADTVENASRLACRFGAPLVCETQRVTAPRKGLEIVGQLLAWAESRLPESELLTVDEVAHMLGVSVRTVWRRVSAEELPKPVQVGGLTKWRRSEIEEWLHG